MRLYEFKIGPLLTRTSQSLGGNMILNSKMKLTNLGTWSKAHRSERSKDIFHLMIEEPDVLT